VQKIRVFQGDITQMKVDAIVNAANAELIPGGGVDGAIHRAAGPELAEAVSHFGVCETGNAVVTPGFQLAARFVIHTVGPIWHDGQRGEPELLASCYRRSLELAIAHDCKQVAFPAISTGVYGYPKDPACDIAVRAVNDFLGEVEDLSCVWLVAFDSDMHQSLVRALEALQNA
jgi:O-acetyl-ADP-ribose deacetylase (regulator of RNase III)